MTHAERLQQALEGMAARQVPETTNLWPRLAARIEERKSLMQTLRTRPALALLILLLALALLTGVAYAVGKSLGYIPGVGIVSQESPLRVLAEPVTVERDDITLTVTQAVLSADKTVVIYRVENIPESALAGDYAEGETPAPRCSTLDGLRLSSGTTFNTIGGQGGGWYTGYEYRDVFNPIPANVNDATLFVSCLLDTAPGNAPENWEVPLHFVPAPPDMTVVPVFEISPTAGSEGGAGGETPAPSASPLAIERSIELDDGYILIGKFHSITLPNGLVTSHWPWSILKFTDANGQEVYADYANDVDLPDVTATSSWWAYRIQGKYFAWPLTITLDSVEASLPGTASFEFDTGADPQPGKQWDLNQDLQIGGYNIRVLSVARNPDGYSFTFKSDPNVQGLGLDIKGVDKYISPAGGGGGGGGDTGDLSASLAYAGEVPEGKLTVVVSGVTVLAIDPWSVQWTPSVLPSGDVTPTPAPQACLTDEVWAQAKSSPAVIPSGLTGKLALMGETGVGSGVWGSVTVNLDGSGRQFHSDGFWPVFSPDGARLVYSSGDGLYVLDLATGAADRLPGTTADDYRSAWSPDGSRIAFTRSSIAEIFVINADGSGLAQVTDSMQYEILAGWSADGTQVIFASAGSDGVQVRSHDLAAGAEQSLFPISSNKADVVVSPEGQWVAFTDRLGMQGNGLFISRLDGSERKLVMALDGMALYFPIWGSEGNWLIVSVPNPDAQDGKPVQALIELDSCQVIPLPDYGGEVHSWRP